ncbi:PREDICTED: threonine synthase-like 2 [Ficedula albicollis]|uniref:Threonine synthase-like 2 n=1 Tax=Ficedula albicollis TaxID=59894 RepID=U3K6H6_FICAL|nr:PREDICTED: threonine synthase-like 2 [Ficedula albicollis]XP_016153642.1 PREDICTED: threonine synthase-like 2 [Ficedula albicollis]XP_016153643.1 PREDICTED: threonine synthase-like 2 [Ficedula albicollis]
MEYVSTRGGTRAVDFEGALFSGYAPDGGLFMPQRMPSLGRDTLQRWSSLSYPELVKELCSLFIPATLVPRNALDELIDRAFSRFRHKSVVHLSRLKDGLNILELWHGVTYAFKDLSLSCTGQFLQYFLEKKQKHVNILVGTSGDTGSSAIESVRGQKNVDIFVLLPKGLCTQIQELQMTTVIEDNVHVFAAHGNSDEIDEPIKELFADVDFAGKYNLMSLNSVNWSRIMVQIAHYFYAYFQCTPCLDTSPLPMVEIVVPTGGGGNITAGCIAQKMGLPIRLVTVVNSNDIIHRTVQNGDFSLAESVKATLASAMDIQEPYNVERILWLLSGSDSRLIKTLMEQFNISKRLKLPEDLHKKLSETLASCSASDQDIVGAMRRCWEENQYLLCPHSAVAAHYHYSQPHSIPRCCLAPASAAKFQDALLRAGLVPQIPPEITALTAMETRSSPLERGQDWAQVLRGQIEAVTQQWEAQVGQSAPQGRGGSLGR